MELGSGRGSITSLANHARLSRIGSKKKFDYEKEKSEINFGVGVAEEDWVIEDAGM